MHFTADNLRARIAAAIDPSRAVSGDGSAQERALAYRAMGRMVRPAAVLVLLMMDAARKDWTITLTQRTAHLYDHAGQICFPGGRQDEDDADLTATALREAQEEIGADASRIEVLGALPHYVTVTAYEVTPIVAIAEPQVFTPEPFEVADIFQLPLAHVLNEQHWRRDGFMRAGQRREYWAIPYRERYVWGATAGMLRTLKTVLSAS